MQSLSLLVAFGLVASAIVLQRQTTTPCTFVMTAVGSPNGTVEEDTLGQNRIGRNYPQGNYIISSNNLSDSQGHSCQFLPTNQQFECTQGSVGSSNFSLADDGNLLHDNCPDFLACGPGNDGSYSIFSDKKTNTTGCEAVTLRTGGFSCAVLGAPNATSTSSAASTQTFVVSTTSTPTPSATSPPSCPTDISAGMFQSPSLIVPTSPEDEDHAFGNSTTAYISPINTTLFTFDGIPYTGTCSLLFLFPYSSSVDPSVPPYYFSGIEEEEGEHGGLDFAILTGVANATTTYNGTPAVAKDYGKTEIIPGNNYTIATFPCPNGQTVTYSASSVADVELDYYQDSNPSPIGLFIVPCS